MKKILTTLLLLFSLLPYIHGQGVVLHLKDGSSVVYPSSDIEKIALISAEEGQLIGTWYLGYWKFGSTAIHFDGSETMSFFGDRVTWAGRQDGSDEYTISYITISQFKLTNINKPSDVTTWSIEKQTDRLIVLRNGGADRYFYKTRKEAQEAQLELDPPSHTETTNVDELLKYAYGFTKSSTNPMGKHYEGKPAATEDNKQWLLDPNNEPNYVAGLSKMIAKDVNLYPFGEPSPADVNQHAIGDCSAMAVFASMAYMYPDFIKSIIKDNGNNTYTVEMFDPQGNPINVCVTNKILCDANGTIGQATGKNNAITWATILEKAFIKWETCFGVDGVEGIGTEFLAPLFTGNGESYAFAPNTLHTSELKLFIEWALGQGMITIGGFNVGGLTCGKLQTVTAHAFTYMLSNNENSIFAMRNPWGIESVDGVLEIPNDRIVVQTIDVRTVNPGKAAPYYRGNLTPYTPPVFMIKKSDIGVSKRLLNRAMTLTNSKELW